MSASRTPAIFKTLAERGASAVPFVEIAVIF